MSLSISLLKPALNEAQHGTRTCSRVTPLSGDASLYQPSPCFRLIFPALERLNVSCSKPLRLHLCLQPGLPPLLGVILLDLTRPVGRHLSELPTNCTVKDLLCTSREQPKADLASDIAEFRWRERCIYWRKCMKIPTRKILPAIASLKAPDMFSKTSRILHRLAVDGMGQNLERRLQISYLFERPSASRSSG